MAAAKRRRLFEEGRHCQQIWRTIERMRASTALGIKREKRSYTNAWLNVRVVQRSLSTFVRSIR
jgi:hypothetical protein